MLSTCCDHRHPGDGLEFRKDPSVCTSSLSFRQGLLTLGEDGFTDFGPADAVPERLRIRRAISSSCLVIQSFFDTLCLASLVTETLFQQVSLCWHMRSVQSCSGTKLQHNATCFMLSHRPKNWALSADIVEERADGLLALELGYLSAMTGTRVSGGECVMELDVDSSTTWATVV